MTLLDGNSQSVSSFEGSGGSVAGRKVYLEAKWMFVARPDTGVRVEE
jgi:hypothetical protein